MILISILDIYKVSESEHIDMLSIGIQEQPYAELYPPYLAQNLGVIWVTCGVNMMSLLHG
jgi:hypothetical protein